jgi:hypothetical protein
MSSDDAMPISASFRVTYLLDRFTGVKLSGLGCENRLHNSPQS